LFFSHFFQKGTEVGLTLQVDQSSKNLYLKTANDDKYTDTMITLDTWQLVGFSVSVRADKKSVSGSVFVDSTSYSLINWNSLTSEIDLSTASTLRINGATDSFIGDVFGLRIGSPAGGVVRQCNKSLLN